MSISFSSTVSKVTCIDVLNNSLQDIVHYCSKNNVSNTTKMWLEHLILKVPRPHFLDNSLDSD
jgi:hypothetical protein